MTTRKCRSGTAFAGKVHRCRRLQGHEGPHRAPFGGDWITWTSHGTTAKRGIGGEQRRCPKHAAKPEVNDGCGTVTCQACIALNLDEDPAYYAGLEQRLAEEERRNPALRRAAEKLEKAKAEIFATPRLDVYAPGLTKIERMRRAYSLGVDEGSACQWCHELIACREGEERTPFCDHCAQEAVEAFVADELPREPTAAELDALAKVIADRFETLPDGRPGDSWDDYDEILRDVWRKTALLAWRLGARPKPEGR
jgi:hypothetical protein